MKGVKNEQEKRICLRNIDPVEKPKIHKEDKDVVAFTIKVLLTEFVKMLE